MPGVRIRTREPEEARERCALVYFPHRLTVLHEPARFAMALSAASLGPVSVGLLGYAGEVRLDTAELETGYEVNIPLSGALATWTGHAQVSAGPGTAAVYRPDGRTSLHGWSGGGHLFGLKIERAALEAELAELVDAPVRSVVHLHPSLDLRAGPGRQWWALASTLIDLTREPDGPMSLPIVARPLAQSVIVALLHAVDHPYRDALAGRPPVPRPASIRQAVELLEAEPEQAVTVTDVARRVGLSTRALQEGFARHVGTPPMAYLRQVRLRRAHADLRAADPTRHGVAEIAGRWGFTHLGRFAAAHRAQYGTSPSEVLHRGA